MNQLAIFEPSGAELAILAASTFQQAEHLDKQASMLECRGFVAAARSYFLKAQAAFDSAFVFEMAAQFEVEAGLL